MPREIELHDDGRMYEIIHDKDGTRLLKPLQTEAPVVRRARVVEPYSEEYPVQQPLRPPRKKSEMSYGAKIILYLGASFIPTAMNAPGMTVLLWVLGAAWLANNNRLKGDQFIWKCLPVIVICIILGLLGSQVEGCRPKEHRIEVSYPVIRGKE